MEETEAKLCLKTGGRVLAMDAAMAVVVKRQEQDLIPFYNGSGGTIYRIETEREEDDCRKG